MSTQQSAVRTGSGQFVGLEPDRGDAYWWLGSLTINKIAGDDLSLVDHLVPAGYTPPLHVHHRHDEVFIVTEGKFAFSCGDETWQADPGAVVFLPRGVPHRFQASEDGPGRALIITAPGGFSEFVEAIGEPTDEWVLPGPDVTPPAPAIIDAASEMVGIERVS